MNKFLTNKEFNFALKLKQKKYRYLNQKFLIEGKHILEEAYKTKQNISLIITTSDYFDQNISFFKNFSNSIFRFTTKEKINKLSFATNNELVVSICDFFKNDNLKLNGNTLVLEQIQDPGNLGTLIRSCVCFNFHNLILEGVDIYNDKVVRSTQGALFYLNIYQDKNIFNKLKELKTNNYQILTTFLDNKSLSSFELSTQNIKMPYALVLGNESKGISKELISLSDLNIYIPISFESLNVAIAGSILMYELNKKIKK